MTTVALPIRRVRISRGDGSTIVERTVIRLRSADALKKKHVVEADIAEAAVRTTLEEVTRDDVECLMSDASIALARKRLAEGNLRALPVVDDDGRLIGMISKSDVLGADAKDEEMIGTVMTRRVHALPESAPLSHALALMALDSIYEIPVVSDDDDGRVIGLFTALDAIKWIATRMGYVLP